MYFDKNNVIEFNTIKEMMLPYAATKYAKEKILQMAPSIREKEVIAAQSETAQARKMIDTLGTPPKIQVEEMGSYLEKADKGGMLLPEELECVLRFINACIKLKGYLRKGEITGNALAFYGTGIDPLTALQEEITRCVSNGTVSDDASKLLASIRRKLSVLHEKIQGKLANILQSKKKFFSEQFVSNRNGCYTLPVKKEYKNQVPGSVVDISSTGSTYFIEPAAVSKFRDEMNQLQIQQEQEIQTVLYRLTALLDEHCKIIKQNIQLIETLDFLFAKGQLSVLMKAVSPQINTERRIEIVNGYHPMLERKRSVPLNFKLGTAYSGIVITGPNTGGKTVCLKTVGLFCMMAQCGLHLPCDQADICMNGSVLCDIGDGQSISQNLSTFSAHMKTIVEILQHVNEESLVLLDELGSGTDPAEGMGIAIATLEYLKEKQCLFLVTTHYPEVKTYAQAEQGVVNACMAFDKQTLKPMYQLEIGKAGDSCALYIAKELGFPQRLLQRAYDRVYSVEAPVCNTGGPADNGALFAGDPVPDTIPGVQTQGGKIVKAGEKTNNVSAVKEKFQMGDSVLVYPKQQLGIVCRPANNKGEVLVQIQKEKILVNHKRLKLKMPASELYPDDYDFSILFDTVENRKLRHQMNKHHQKDAEIILQEEAYG